MSHAHELEVMSLAGSEDGAVIGFQTLFREVNDRIRTLAPLFENGSLELICECELAACREPLLIQPDEYDAVRAFSNRFLVRPGHERAGERIVTIDERFVVVEKSGR